MIPSEFKTAVSRGLHEAFNTDEIDDIRDLTERPGSNRAFRIVVRGATCLLRINTRRGDVARQFTCMRAAAEAGLAPRVFYTNTEDRISITDFVAAVPLPAEEALVRVPATLRKLHSLPPFSAAPFNTTCTFLLNGGSTRDQFIERFRASNLLPPHEASELLSRYEQIVAVYSRLDPDTAPSHNDLFKPDNMLFDGNRLWLVDWEAAFQNDRYADLAVVANMLVTNEQDEELYLTEYFGAPPDEYQRARFHLMRQVAHMFYSMAFLAPASSETPMDWNSPAPAYKDYQQRFWNGEVTLQDTEAKAVYGRVHWERLSENLRQPRFDEALRIVALPRTAKTVDPQIT